MAPETTNTDAANNKPPTPPFARCPKCNYSLTGLPANHQCPECGLKYDSNCESYCLRNRTTAIVILFCTLLWGIVAVRSIEDPAELWSKVSHPIFHIAIAVTGIISSAVVITLILNSYRRVQGVVTAPEGLFIRLPDHAEELIPWEDLGEASVKPLPENRPQIVRIQQSQSKRPVMLGGDYNIFPTKADAERFVAQVNARTAAIQEQSE